MADTKTHYLPKQKKIYVLSCVCLLSASAPLVLHIAFSGKYTGNSGTWIPFSLLWTMITILVFIYAQKTRLVITNLGLVVYGILLEKEVRWEDIDGIVIGKNSFLLSLKKPAVPMNSITKWFFRKGLVASTLMSLDDFCEYWENGTLSKDFPAYILTLANAQR